MGSAAVQLGPHRPPVTDEVWEGPGGLGLTDNARHFM